MPHIKVKPFDTKIVDSSKDSFIEFKAKSNGNEIILVNFNGVKVFLDIIKREKEYLIKPNKITKI